MPNLRKAMDPDLRLYSYFASKFNEKVVEFDARKGKMAEAVRRLKEAEIEVRNRCSKEETVSEDCRLRGLDELSFVREVVADQRERHREMLI